MPGTLTVQFANSAMADVADLIPGVERSDAVTASFTSSDYLEAFSCIRAMIMMAGAVGT